MMQRALVMSRLKEHLAEYKEISVAGRTVCYGKYRIASVWDTAVLVLSIEKVLQ